MKRTVVLAVAIGGIIVVGYQHLTIFKLTRQSDLLLAQMRVEYGRKIAQLNDSITEKRVIERELDQAKSQLAFLRSENKSLAEGIALLVESREDLEKRIALMALDLGRKQPRSVSGNRGFVIWRGKPTLEGRRSVEVTPAPMPSLAEESQF